MWTQPDIYTPHEWSSKGLMWTKHLYSSWRGALSLSAISLCQKSYCGSIERFMSRQEAFIYHEKHIQCAGMIIYLVKMYFNRAKQLYKCQFLCQSVRQLIYPPPHFELVTIALFSCYLYDTLHLSRASSMHYFLGQRSSSLWLKNVRETRILSYLSQCAESEDSFCCFRTESRYVV